MSICKYPLPPPPSLPKIPSNAQLLSGRLLAKTMATVGSADQAQRIEHAQRIVALIQEFDCRWRLGGIVIEWSTISKIGALLFSFGGVVIKFYQ